MQRSEVSWQDYQPGRRLVSLIEWRDHLRGIPRGVIDVSAASLPAKGEICTIASTAIGQTQGNLVLFLEEHPPLMATVLDGAAIRRVVLGFEAQYFRPLDETRLDQFRAMLDAKPADAPEAVPA